MKILVIEDEENVLEVVEAYLKKEKFQVYTSSNGALGLELFFKHNPDFIVLDLMLPDISGEEICKRIRKQSNVPILMLTAKSSVDDRIIGLSIGADDYLIKPFSPRELIMRIKTIMRRTSTTEPLSSQIEFNNGDLKIDELQHKVYKKNKLIELTPVQYKLLMFFIRNPKKVFSRDELIEHVLGSDFDGYDRTIDAHIKNIRRKIEDDPKHPKYIITVFGFGYKFEGE
ncbi:sensory transduction protein regX3 [Clostridium tepidiprofundi DSM 19306]|uniref:Stage 0 sporulation protein A homolog n=1 Tax=Clostridium tepidiprofundi DSM 19306 TaxID=1121338 RepID=A0A151B6Y4_9CLOT|nr:response regulator transcription factor [Clostridium tepidiprofundi]KYH35407.1 sensory transduction protein regX3 [Clostridium tepidiprofundi DSM 19306]